jgi:nicotinate-nucleotide adenylyltransferase
MRLGILGGSFDPVHYGHLLFAELCREQTPLDAVWFLPAATPPHKQGRELSSAHHRVEMLRLAIGGNTAFDVCTLEVDRGGLSFTVDTLAELTARHPAAQLFLLLGGDMLADLPTWREPARICQLATLVAARRPGGPAPDSSRLADLLSQQGSANCATHQLVDMPQLDLSSSEIRRRVAAGLSIRYQTPRAVEKYIETHGLYLPVAKAGT